MGSNCSAKLSNDDTPTGCGRLQRIGRCEEECEACDSDVAADMSNEHPLLLRRQQEMDGSNTTPRTPRGPAPPWALEQESRRDRTATGVTPPRSPTVVKTVPPGLPEEEAPEGAIALAGSFGADFIQELYRQARGGDAARMSVQLQKVHSAAFSLLSGSGIGYADGGHPTVAEQSDGAAELAKDFLDQVRDAKKSTLLGAATEGGIHVVHMLLLHKADPLVSDAKGQTPLHQAAEHGSLLAALMLLDRMQGNDRLVSLADLTDGDGETPEMKAAMSGKAELCHALEVFRQMQTDAQLRQLGSALQPPDPAGHRISTGDLVSFLDLQSAHSGVLLRHVSVGSVMVPNLFKRIPDDPDELAAMIDRVCAGLHAAEDFLRRHRWDSSDPGLDPVLKSFVASAELRSQWHKIRLEASAGKGESELEDFWQTHLTADAMASTIRNALGDTFQLLLTALWLYTREAWLRHLLDALAVALQSLPLSEARDGATGSAPESAPAALQPLVEALAPSMQLVQSALSWFEEANIHHTAATYRPLLLPMLGLQKLVDRYVAFRKAETPKETLESGCWLSLGGGSFFSALSSRNLAIARLAKSRCNVLLIIRPDEKSPSYPKHMSLRGSNVDDSLFPLESLFRISRITRSVSSELDVDGTSGLFKGANSRWPVIVIEVHSVNCYAEVMGTLYTRGQLGASELNGKVEEWLQSCPPEREAERLHVAGLVFSKAAKAPQATRAEQLDFLEKARAALQGSVASATSAGHLDLAAQALASKVRLGSREEDVREAVELLKSHFGGRPLTQNAKELVQELTQLGVSDVRLA